MQNHKINLIEELQWRGLIHQSTSPDLAEILQTSTFPCYIGFDPSADSLHVGSLLQIMLLVRMQQAGHRPITLVGGATGMIGDPSGKSEERNLLDRDRVEHNLRGIRAQLEQFLDFSPGPSQAVVVNNHDWLGSISLLTFLRDVGKRFSVNAMMDKDSVRTRLEEREQGISYTEFSYMLLQAYDFLKLYETHGCRLQLGGSDQWGNITAGVDLVRRVHGERVHGLTSPLLTSSDGKKLGKTEQGTVWLNSSRTSVYQFYQYWMRIEDRDVGRMLRMLTFLTREEIEEIEYKMLSMPELRIGQKTLAWNLTSFVHGESEALKAKQASELMFSQSTVKLSNEIINVIKDEIPNYHIHSDEKVRLIDVLVSAQLSKSKSTAINDILSGCIYVNEKRVSDVKCLILDCGNFADRYVLIKKGKKNFALIVFD